MGERRSHPLKCAYLCLYADSTHLKQSWNESRKNIAAMIVIDANSDGYRKAANIAEGSTESRGAGALEWSAPSLTERAPSC